MNNPRPGHNDRPGFRPSYNDRPGYNADRVSAERQMSRDRYTGEYVERDEWTILSGIAKEGNWLFNECLSIGLTAQAFADSRASFVWDCLSLHIRDGRPMSEDAMIRTIDDQLETARYRAQTDEKFRPPYLNKTGEEFCRILYWVAEYRSDQETVKFLAGRVTNRWRFKRAERELARLSQEAATWTGSPEEFVSHVQNRVMALPSVADQGASIKNLGELLPGYLDQKFEDYGKPDNVRGVQTGIPSLDKATHGIKPGEVVIVAAGSGVGKTSMAINIAAEVAASGGRVLVFSLEMKWQAIAERLIWMSAQVNSGRYWRGEMTQADWEKISHATGRMQAQNIDIIDDASLTMPQIQAIVARERFRRGVDAVIVDYAQLVESGNKSDTREQEVAAVSKGLVRLASEAPVIALSQMNDDGKLRESRALYHDASHVWILSKSSEQAGLEECDKVKRYELKIQKGRNSADDKTIRLLYFYEQTRLEEEIGLEEAL